MIEKEKEWLNQCIKKYSRLQGYTNETLAEQICSKYMISRMNHGYLCKEKTYHALLERLGFYYTTPDIFDLKAISSQLLNAICKEDTSSIHSCIHKLDAILSMYPDHLYYEEMKIFVNFLKLHYVTYTSLPIETSDLISIAYLPYSFQTCIIHTIFENLLYHARFIEMEELAERVLPTQDHLLCEYWKMCILTADKNKPEAFNIYRNHQYKLKENHDYYQLNRFYLLHAYGDMRKLPDVCHKRLDKIQTIITKGNLHSKQDALVIFAYGLLAVRNQENVKAYTYFKEGLYTYDYAENLFYPYYVILSILLYPDEKIEYTLHNETKFNKNIEQLYALNQRNKEYEMMSLLTRYFSKNTCENRCFEMLVPLLQQLVIHLVEKSRCYKKAFEFDQCIKKQKRNYY